MYLNEIFCDRKITPPSTPPHPTPPPRNRKIYTWKIALQQISPWVTARIIVRFMEGSNLPGGGNFSGEQFSVYLFVIVTSSIWPKSLLYCRTLQNWRVNRWYSIISKKKERKTATSDQVQAFYAAAKCKKDDSAQADKSLLTDDCIAKMFEIVKEYHRKLMQKIFDDNKR